ncbi:tigger transposable element-derived protein 4-like [Parasteatoda tepidariorum]|uniref:tigger transposable element-derived protein 4-like n=1 Tax=Parasteatoda tepidariorum TaxID=114398 RepID=UPI0039BCC69D
MTLDLMTEWLLELDRKMGHKNRTVLFLDNAASPPNNNLKNVKIAFFPLNVTSVCQPLDQGVIKNFKVFYRQLISKHLIMSLDGPNKENAGFKKDTSECNILTDVVDDTISDDTFSELTNLIRLTGESVVNGNDFVKIDENIECQKNDLNMDEIVEMVTNIDAESENEDIDTQLLPEYEPKVKTLSDAQTCIEELRHFYLSRNYEIGVKMLYDLKMYYEDMISVFNKKMRTLLPSSYGWAANNNRNGLLVGKTTPTLDGCIYGAAPPMATLRMLSPGAPGES